MSTSGSPWACSLSRSRSSLPAAPLTTHVTSICSALSWPRSRPSRSSPGAAPPLAVFALPPRPAPPERPRLRAWPTARPDRRPLLPCSHPPSASRAAADRGDRRRLVRRPHWRRRHRPGRTSRRAAPLRNRCLGRRLGPRRPRPAAARASRRAGGRVARAERETERERRLAAAEERTRIARDLHDSAGHAINVILVQAGAARLLQEQDPTRTRAALETIEEVARETLSEIDQLVRVLREDGSANGSVEPPPGLAALETLAERHRAAGLAVDVRFDGAAGTSHRGRPDGLPDPPGGADQRRPARRRQRRRRGRVRPAGARAHRHQPEPSQRNAGRRPRPRRHARAHGAARRQLRGGRGRRPSSASGRACPTTAANGGDRDAGARPPRRRRRPDAGRPHGGALERRAIEVVGEAPDGRAAVDRATSSGRTSS